MITFERAKSEDCELIFKWRNHPRVRKYSLNERALTFKEHCLWFNESLSRHDRIILLAYEDDQEVGVVRYDLLRDDPQTAEISIYISPELHGRGLGSKILAQAESWLQSNTNIRTLIAKIKEENAASVKIFKRCGFKPEYTIFRKDPI